jgi:hypothetical protein
MACFHGDSRAHSMRDSTFCVSVLPYEVHELHDWPADGKSHGSLSMSVTEGHVYMNMCRPCWRHVHI